jgi:hypothetical protein
MVHGTAGEADPVASDSECDPAGSDDALFLGVVWMVPMVKLATGPKLFSVYSYRFCGPNGSGRVEKPRCHSRAG